MKAAGIFDINGTCNGTEIVGEEAQDVFAKFRDLLLTADGCSQAQLCIPQPLFALLRQSGFSHQCGDREGQDDAKQPRS